MASAAVVQQGGQDLSVLLSQVKVLETDRERLTRALEEAQRKIEDEQRRMGEVNTKMERLTEGKRAEMQQAFDTVIKKWLADSVQDEKVRQEFQTGMSRLVENTAEDSGVWQVRAPTLFFRLCTLILITCTGCVLCIQPTCQAPARNGPASTGDQHAQDHWRGGVPRGELAQTGARRGPAGWPTGRAKGYLARL
jgi:hypothetical protein